MLNRFADFNTIRREDTSMLEEGFRLLFTGTTGIHADCAARKKLVFYKLLFPLKIKLIY